MNYEDMTNEELWEHLISCANEGRNFDIGEDDWHTNTIRMIIDVLEQRTHDKWSDEE